MPEPVKRPTKPAPAPKPAAPPKPAPAPKPAAPPKAPRTEKLRLELEAEIAQLEEELKPHREFYEAHANDPKYLESMTEIRRINAELAPRKNDLAAIARAGGARSMAARAGTYEGE